MASHLVATEHRATPAGIQAVRLLGRRADLAAVFEDTVPVPQRVAKHVDAPTDWGHIAECTDLGDLPTDVEPRMPEPSGWFVAVLGIACIAAVAACALIAQHLP